MNLRQKAKRYKRLYEKSLTNFVEQKIIHTNYPIVHLRAEQVVMYDDPFSYSNNSIKYANEINAKNLFSEVIKFIKVETEDDLYNNCKKIKGDIWIVDRRLD